jgi:hypothetical protein
MGRTILVLIVCILLQNPVQAKNAETDNSSRLSMGIYASYGLADNNTYSTDTGIELSYKNGIFEFPLLFGGIVWKTDEHYFKGGAGLRLDLFESITAAGKAGYAYTKQDPSTYYGLEFGVVLVDLQDMGIIPFMEYTEYIKTSEKTVFFGLRFNTTL